MQNSTTTRRRRKPGEEGYLLLSIMFLLFLLALSLSIAAPRMARSIQRDRDVETMERGKQYIRAVQLYYRKFHAYPPSVDALVKSNNIRFLRKKYTDPITGKDDWKPILYGQNKVPVAMGFFGQPMGTSSVAGIGPSGNNSNSSLGGGLFSSSSSGSSPTDTSGGGSTSTSGQTGTTGTAGAIGTGSGTNSSSDSSGQTFGGAGIIGFSPGSSKQSILIWKKKDHYNQWEFTYDPIMDMRTMSGGNTGAIGQPASNTTTPVGSPGTPTGSGSGGSGSGGSGFSLDSSPSSSSGSTNSPQQ
jgi:type II secretory pathway pseudopilin PulG